MMKTEDNAVPGGERQEAQALADLAARARKKGEALALARRALELDGECTDAQVLVAREEAGSPRDLAGRLKLIVDRAEAKLGTPFIRDQRGGLWDVPEAHPYLRARLALAEALEKAGKASQAVPHLEELTKLDAGDHLGARFRLVRCLLADSDMKPLAALLKTWDHGDPAFTAWAELLERIRSKASKDAEKALVRARKANPHFEDYLTGKRKLPKQIPENPEPGSPEEAAATLRLFGETWTGDREAMYWLFKHA